MALENRRGIWHVRAQVCGKKIHRSTGLPATAANRRVAAALEVRLREEASLEARFGVKAVEHRTFKSACQEFVEWLAVEHKKTSTYRNYSLNMRIAERYFGDASVAGIRSGDVEQFKVWRTASGVKPATVRFALITLSKFFAYAKRRGWCEVNPVSEVKKPSDRDSARTRVVTPEEEKRYFASAALTNPTLHDVARLILLQGMRPHEVLNLKAEDVDLERQELHIAAGKTPSARRVLHLAAESRTILAERINSGAGFLFRPTKRDRGKPMSYPGLIVAHSRNCRRAGVKFLLYDLRHTFATRMAEFGTDIPTLAALLGHSSLRIVQRYIHPSAEHKRAAMAAYDNALNTGAAAA
jgi:integrase